MDTELINYELEVVVLNPSKISNHELITKICILTSLIFSLPDTHFEGGGGESISIQRYFNVFNMGIV